MTSVDEAGKANIITVGWTMRASTEPPTFAIGLGMRSHSCANISRSGEFVIALPGADLAKEAMYCGTHSGTEVDKFAEAGLTALDAKCVRAPLIGECLANLECKVVASHDLSDHRVFFGEVQACWGADRDVKPLLSVGDDAGYEVIHEEGRFKLGKARSIEKCKMSIEECRISRGGGCGSWRVGDG